MGLSHLLKDNIIVLGCSDLARAHNIAPDIQVRVRVDAIVKSELDSNRWNHKQPISDKKVRSQIS